MEDFTNFANEQSEGAAPFKDVDSNDVKYLHMRTKALETWERVVQRSEEKLFKKQKEQKEKIAIE